MDSRLMKPKAAALPKTLLLKDYLLDDFSSCSSNGFKSFPRKQCCTTVRFLLEIDLKSKQTFNDHKKYLNFISRNPPTIPKAPSRLAFSAFQSVITAVKRLPFSSSSTENKQKKKKNNYSFLPRSFSKKMLKKSGFWKRKSNKKEVQRWKSFDQLLKEDSQPLDRSDNSSASNSDSQVNSILPQKSKDAIGFSNDVGSHPRVVETNGDVSMYFTTSSECTASINSSTNIKKQWPNEEKEQFSPVSVLDCPFDDDDEVSSPFLACMEGTKKKFVKKIQRFETLVELGPVSLVKRFASLPESDNESIGSPLQLSSSSIDERFISDIEENAQEQKAIELLDQMKDTMPPYGLKLNLDKLLVDFFQEKMSDNFQKQYSGFSFDEEVLEEAEDWINNRKPFGVLVNWEVQKNRQAYIKEMERRCEWRTSDKGNEEMVLELEAEIFAALLDELVLDISSMVTI